MKSSFKLINSIFLLFKTLDFKRKYQFLGVILINIINGLFEFISLGSALFFLETLTDSSKVSSSFASIISIFNLYQEKELIRFSTLMFLIVISLTALIRILNLWLNTKFRISFLNFISNKIYRKVINQEYFFFINKNNSELLTDLTSNIEKTNFFFENLLTLITSLVLSLSIIFSLLKLNFYITIISVLFFSSLYAILGIFINKKVDKSSKIEIESNLNLVKNIQNSLNSIKEIIVSNNHLFYIEQFQKNNFKLRKYQGIIGFITTFPRYLFEGIGLFFIGISGFIIYSYFNNSANIIALLGAFALGAQKLLPTMQSSYKSWSLLYFYNKPLDRILELLKLSIKNNSFIKEKLPFNKEIKIKNLNFSYDNNSEISKNINLTIKKGENIGVFGKTGSGKTTLINILMGILIPREGSILVDNKNLFDAKNTNILNKWRNNISLVPQDVFLYDASIKENIAFCVPKNEIDTEKVKFASKIACAHEFIIKTKNGYETIVGDNGIKLSGGQKQRIGIARAIYINSEILIFDESTSSLDLKTEKSVIESIYNSKSNNYFTTITIAHRLSTLRYCDKILELSEGEIKKIYSNKEYLKKFKDFF